MASIGGWFHDTARTYIGNASAKRDFRVQLRGSRAVLLWALYLLVLIGFGLITYSTAVNRGAISVAYAQRALNDFYRSILYLLAGLIMLIAPALSATSIVSERQRQSLDLIFSAPVTPNYYLVGKLISSYRYLWMLLVLSLPVTAACVVLGGAVWSEVLAAYVLLSVHGLLYTALALLVSSWSTKPVGAIITSYALTCAVTFIGFSAFGTTALMRSYGPMMSGGRINEAPFTVAMSPFTVLEAAPTYMTIFGVQVPNWLLGSLAMLLVVRLVLIGASSTLSGYGAKEIKALRINSLVYILAISYGIAASLASAFSSLGAGSYYGGTGPSVSSVVGRMFVGMLGAFFFFVPFITCYGSNLEKKFWYDGEFSFKKMIQGTPAGGLPFLLSMSFAAAAGIYVGCATNGVDLTGEFWLFVVYAMTLMFFLWSLGRFASAMNTNLRQARGAHFGLIILLLFIPLAFFAASAPNDFDQSPSIWDLAILRPVINLHSGNVTTGFWCILLLFSGFVIYAIARNLHQKRQENKPAYA